VNDDDADRPDDFAAALTNWRTRRRMTKRVLAEAMGFDRSYVSHIEAGRHRASAAFARKAETTLNAGGELWRAWTGDDGSGSAAGPGRAVVTRGSVGLVVEHDHAELRYDQPKARAEGRGVYTAAMRRVIVNTGPDPVTRYLIRISVDRHPGDPEASNRLYRAHPLTFDDLHLTATCDGEPMAWEPKLDRDSFKEVWLRLENDHRRFPLYPGDRAVLEYSYQVGDDQWGTWFQRAVRLPTLDLSVSLVFPARLRAEVWGTETSTTAEAVPLHTSIIRRDDDGADVFEWSTTDPPLNARYRLEWQFPGQTGSEDGQAEGVTLRMASDRMKAAGIIQQGDPVLARTAIPFNLPDEASAAQDLVDDLLAAMARVREHHMFSKGMGLAAPQIGITRAAAVIVPPGDDADPIVLLNSVVVSASADTDEQYEGCLSFFDVRGLVLRPLRLEVEHTALNGDRLVTVFTDGMARLVAHEIDHLYGRLYTDRMRPGVQPISVAEYNSVGVGTGTAWRYGR
jgi:peptide deformylase